MSEAICGVISASGRHGEPLACAFPAGHAGPHAWASLPTFAHGRAVTTAHCTICGAHHNEEYSAPPRWANVGPGGGAGRHGAG